MPELKSQNAEILSLLKKMMGDIEKSFKISCEILKKEGFGESKKTRILQAFAQLNRSEKVQIFHKNIEAYLETLSQKAAQLKRDYWVCSSDIIESFFGKEKLRQIIKID